MKKISIGILLIALVIPLLIGGISAAISSQGMALYGDLETPPLSPPAWVFSVAWTILYLMMGLASYFIIVAEVENRQGKAMAVLFYAIQLVVNFMWSLIFFRWSFYLFAFIWLLLLWGLVIYCIYLFYPISRTAAYLLIPYILWLTFAAYLNMGAFILSINRK